MFFSDESSGSSTLEEDDEEESNQRTWATKTYKGWLTKRALSGRNYRERFFVLKRGVIYYFTEDWQPDECCKGKIILDASSQVGHHKGTTVVSMLYKYALASPVRSCCPPPINCSHIGVVLAHRA